MIQDLRERFLKFRTLRGMLKACAAVIIAYFTFTSLQHAIEATFYSLAGFYLIDGLRDIFVNPVKQAIKHERLIEERIANVEQNKAAANRN